MVCVHDNLYNFFSGLTCKHAEKPQNETMCVRHMGGGWFGTIKPSSGTTGAGVPTVLQVLYEFILIGLN